MNTLFKYKFNKKEYTCDFGFKFIETACDKEKTDLEDIPKDVFGVDSKKTGKKDKEGNPIYEPKTLPTYKMVSIAYHLLYYGIIANDELDGKVSTITLRKCNDIVFGNSEKLVQVYNDAFNCAMSFLVGQDVSKIEDEPKEKKRRSPSKKPKK